MKVKEREIDLWIDRNKLPSSMKKEIMPNVQRMLEEKKDIDVHTLLSHLPCELGRKIKRYICLPMLNKVSPLPSFFFFFFCVLFDKLSAL
jgi:cyclic nucleotide gated channel